MKQDEEMMMLKDMVKSTALQIKVKDGELKRVRNRGSSQTMPGSPNSTRKANQSTLLPSIRGVDTSTDYESQRLDKLSELSSKFKIQQMRGRFIERGIQTGGGGAKHAQTQCTPAVTNKDFGAQSDGVKFMDK